MADDRKQKEDVPILTHPLTVFSVIEFLCAQFFKRVKGSITPIIINLGTGDIPDFFT